MENIRERKLKRYFTAIDADGSGTLTRGDFELVARRYVDALNLAPDSHQAEKTRTATLKIWDDLISPMDANGDGKVSPEEFIDALQKSLATDRAAYAESIRPSANAYFELCDADDNGEVDEQEYIRLMGAACGIPADEAAATYRTLVPPAHDGMTRESWHEMLLSFFYDEEPDSPANHIFGRL
ncbi:EF-hand domain-containing protein [Streptomyces sp. NPDC058257]|uniref:EF-hand domain-containing protein n=1 Tax=Streptomyces sp. NPDC058257 TaxID=3346409 RepID=UPI0036E62E03